ncbi:hypothetical protein SEA_SUMTER_57 [Mycobacterium phage Sumter]|nr:hypothetical protein SEA_SUMTER_57 [Mycobacterium phage Sumter]
MNKQEKLARIREFCNSVPERDPGYEAACDIRDFIDGHADLMEE